MFKLSLFSWLQFARFLRPIQTKTEAKAKLMLPVNIWLAQLADAEARAGLSQYVNTQQNLLLTFLHILFTYKYRSKTYLISQIRLRHTNAFRCEVME